MSGGGGVTPNLPAFPQGANYVFQNQPAADQGAFSGIQQLGNFGYFPQQGQSSIYNPTQTSYLPQIAQEYNNLRNIMQLFQPGTPLDINAMLRWGNNAPTGGFRMPQVQQSTTQPTQPGQGQSQIQSGITPQEAQLLLGLGSSGGVQGAGALTGPMLQSIQQLAQGGGAYGTGGIGAGNVPTNDSALAAAIIQSGGAGNLNSLSPGQLATLNTIAMQPGYQGSAASYDASNPYWLQGQSGFQTPSSTYSGIPGSGTGNTGQGLNGTMLGGPGGTGIGGAPAPGTASGLANPTADIFAQYAPMLAAFGMAQGSQGEALMANVLHSVAGLPGQAQQLFNQVPGLMQQGSNLFQQAGQIPGLTQQIAQMAFDPQQQLYQRTQQQVIDQTRSGLEARGIDMGPYGAGTEADAIRNFNIDWQNNLLSRATQGATGISGLDQAMAALSGVGGDLFNTAGNLDTTGANLIGQYGRGLSLGQSMGNEGISSMTGMLQALQGGALGATALTQQQIGDYLQYLSGATAQNNAAISGYSAQVQAALGAAQLQQQANQFGIGQLGQLGSGIGSLGGKLIGAGIGK